MRAVISVGLAIAAMAVGAAFYPGSLSIYLLFSLVFFAILYSGVGLSFQYSHFFIAIAWFIGFWLKLVVHYIFGHLGLNAAQYVEPTGSFDGSPGSWDAVLLTASIGGLGYLCGRLVLVPLIRTQSSTETRLDAPSWYARFRNRIWISAAVILVAIVVTNQETGLIVRGYVPRIQLPWPLGGLFAWTTDIGFALALSVLAAWDRTAGAGLARGFLALCIEGAVLSIATNSRGLYLFHTLPAVVSEARRAVFVRSRVLAAGGFAVIWLVGAVTIPLITTGLRGFGDQAVLAKVEANAVEIQSKPSVEPSVAPAPATTNGAHRGEVLGAFVRYSLEGSSRLIIDRWIGLEGVMAVVSYPERGPLLFKEAALQRRTYGMIDVYTGKVSGTQVTEEHAKTHHSATLAGPIAFFYYSGSLPIVFGGMMLVAMLMSVLEMVWTYLARDRLIVAMSGCYLALVVMQMSTGIVQVITGPVTVSAFLALVWLMTRKTVPSRPRPLPRKQMTELI